MNIKILCSELISCQNVTNKHNMFDKSPSIHFDFITSARPFAQQQIYTRLAQVQINRYGLFHKSSSCTDDVFFSYILIEDTSGPFTLQKTWSDVLQTSSPSGSRDRIIIHHPGARLHLLLAGDPTHFETNTKLHEHTNVFCFACTKRIQRGSNCSICRHSATCCCGGQIICCVKRPRQKSPGHFVFVGHLCT